MSARQAHLIRSGTIPRIGWRIRLLLFLFSALLCALAAEVAARAFWRVGYGIGVRDPGSILYAYYPELRAPDMRRPSHEDKFYDVLFLGASTLHMAWGQIAQDLREQLTANGYHDVRIFNLAQPAQTSRDSLIKYAALSEARFELVVFYDGINEARANNAPPEVFREDYAHYSWYENVNTLAPYHRATSFALPYTLRYLAIRVRDILTKDRHVPTHGPREDWLQYGRDARSAASFKHNLNAILDLATERGDQVLLMTFATYVPDDYSFEAFMAKRLDYRLHLNPIETWGLREHVTHAIAAHNEIVRALAAEHHTLFVDQAKLMVGSKLYFNDVCHFTVAGSWKFVEHLLPVLLSNPSTGEQRASRLGGSSETLARP